MSPPKYDFESISLDWLHTKPGGPRVVFGTIQPQKLRLN